MNEAQPAKPLFVTVSSRISDLSRLSALLGGPVVLPRAVRNMANVRAVLAWGCKPSAAKAKAYAAQYGLPLWRLEDGFVRSVQLGHADPPLSIVVDDLGIYYDAGSPSVLERMIVHPRNAAQISRAKTLIEQWRHGRISKYNHSREMCNGLPDHFVLVTDQTRGDLSIRYGLADAPNFTRMLEAALDRHPGQSIVLKVHPEVFAGHKRGHFERISPGQASRIQVLGTDVHPANLLERAAAVYAVTSQLGFEGLLWGKSVYTFGMPFYAGWGLTVDNLPAAPRRRPTTLENLIYAALIEYARYFNAEQGKRCEAEHVLQYLALQRRMRERHPEQVYLLGFKNWKKPVARAYFAGSRIKFVSRSNQIPPSATLAVWGRRPMNGALPENVAQFRVEDGFLRSVGLGGDLVWPLSWVIDRRGIYYDATAPSDLEDLLQNSRFDASLTERAKHLRKAVVALGLTKYNVGVGVWQRPADASKVILVPGQLQADASILYGSPFISNTLELLRIVREANPEAYIVYKLHPETQTVQMESLEAETWCDEIIRAMPVTALYEKVDEVHVLTSQAGFEALLRGIRVVTYGHPFYAGWGLTEDRFPIPRRARRLSLDELVAAVLILYPTYVSRTTGFFTTPEHALEELSAWREQGTTPPPLWIRINKKIAQCRDAVKAFTHTLRKIVAI
ncbi:MAG: capsular polysaccharide biosynthesis protein [Gammaproteobacteria bacterium]